VADVVEKATTFILCSIYTVFPLQHWLRERTCVTLYVL